MSSRRVKKGPGRRPLSAKREQFMRLQERGWPIATAAREVGISRSAANNWVHGHRTYRNGAPVGFVAPLERRAVRQIHPRFLSQQERIQIADLRQAGHGVRVIAAQVGRSPSTISRELRRNQHIDGAYRPFEAQRQAVVRRGRAHPRKVHSNARLRREVDELLQQRWSPQQISAHLRKRHRDDPKMQLCPESIYQAVYEPDSTLRRPTPLAPHRASPLRTGRIGRRGQQRSNQRRVRFEQPMLTIHERSFAPDERGEHGHWEGDLILGKDLTSAVATLVERSTRILRLIHLPHRDADSLHHQLVERMNDLPAGMMRSITWDQGTEMARHRSIAEALRAPVYFCDARSPWQRGSNENTNGLLRDYFPKGTSLKDHTQQHLLAVQDELNRRPRKVLGGQSPLELFDALLCSEGSKRCDDQ